jgi:uncharacterized protein (DUF2252 family)
MEALPDKGDSVQKSTELPHLTPSERRARGKAARAETPRASHAKFEPGSNRPDPVALLESQAEARVPDLVPIRYGRMLVSPFTFYRGAALIMANDLAATPRSGLRVQLCGDAHLSNFGVFASPERRLIFDLNDFDETLPGPWEWDVKRLAASITVAGRERGFSTNQRKRIVRATVAAYREAMREFAGMPNLKLWYSRLDTEAFMAEYGASVDSTVRKRAGKDLAKARTKDSMKAFEKLTSMVDGEPRIVADPPLIVPVEDLAAGIDPEQLTDWIREMLRGYRSSLQPDRRQLLEQFRFVQIAHKVVGVGSVGTRAWIVLMLGRDGGDPLFLQAKQAQASVLEEFAGSSDYENEGERVVVGQWLMQAASDILLGWQHVVGIDGIERDFYVRQLKDWKGSAEVEVMVPEGMNIYGRICGWTLARAHARSGDRIAIASYLGKGDVFDCAIAEFSEAYADQNDRDHAALLDAVDSGRITAQRGL